MGESQRREFHEALLDAASFEDLPGKWQAAIVMAEQNRSNLRVVSAATMRSPALLELSNERIHAADYSSIAKTRAQAVAAAEAGSADGSYAAARSPLSSL